MQNIIAFITGRKGSGKTSLADEMANGFHKSGHRVLALAPMGDITLPGAPLITSVKQLIAPSMANQSAIFTVDNEFNLPASLFKYAYICGGLTLIVDEIDMYLSTFQPDEYLLNIVRYGRHKAINLIGASQRPARVVRDLTAQADKLFIFHMTENRDLDYLAARIGRTDADRVRALPRFTYLIYDAAAGAITGQGQTHRQTFRGGVPM